jgi:hypothetical protein
MTSLVASALIAEATKREQIDYLDGRFVSHSPWNAKLLSTLDLYQ